MKKVRYHGGVRGFLKGKGFFIALLLSVSAIGGATYVAYRQTIDNLLNDGTSYSEVTSERNTWVFPEEQDVPVDVTQPDVPKDPPVTTSVTTAVTTTAKTEAKEEIPAVRQITEEAEEVNLPINNVAPKVMPVNGEILNPFSGGELVYSETLKVWKTHTGVDIKADIGTQVRSMTAGKVTLINEDPLWGICVVIDHGDGYEGHYCGLAAAVTVKQDETVEPGTIIGAVGNTAEIEIAEESHLHFGLKKNNEWIDPLSVMSDPTS